MGEKFYIENIAGTLAYEVDHIDVIDPSDFQQLLVVPGKDYATLLTCTPIMINTHRLIVRGHRVPYVPEVDEKVKEDKGKNLGIDKRLIILLIFAIIILGRYLLSKRKKKLAKKRAMEKAKNIELAKMNISANNKSVDNIMGDGNSGNDDMSKGDGNGGKV